MQAKPKVLFLGTLSVFSRTVLKGFLGDGVAVCAVAIPGSFPLMMPQPPRPNLPSLPVEREETIVSLGRAAGLPVIPVQNTGDSQTRERLAALRADFMLVGCFPYILPPTWLRLARHAALNLHPSWLPRYRGPTPMFWQFRNGEQDTGITLHRIAGQVDAGDIVLQDRLVLPDGISGEAADRLLAEGGVRVFMTALERWGTLKPWPQSEAQASYYPKPAQADFQLSTDWSARRAFNFLRGTRVWGQDYQVTGADESVWIRSALSYAAEGRLARAIERQGSQVCIQFSPGIVRATVASSDGTGSDGR